MSQRLHDYIKGKCSSSIKCTYQYQQSNINNLQKIKDRFDEGYDSDGEPGPLLSMEDIEDT